MREEDPGHAGTISWSALVAKHTLQVGGATLLLPSVVSLGCDPQYGNLGYTYKPCPGECVPLPPLDFTGPALLWFGPAAEAPECPGRAPTTVFEGIDGVQNEPLNCPPCECSQPTCAFPDGLTAHTQAFCGGAPTDFSTPSSWNGSCTDVGPANQLRAITVPPVTERPCEPIAQIPQKGPDGAASFTTRAKAATCVAAVSVFQDGGCTTPLFADVPIGMTDTLCVDIMAGLQLGSMEATWLTNEPGSCVANGGEAVGEVKPKDPRTFCCQPPH